MEKNNEQKSVEQLAEDWAYSEVFTLPENFYQEKYLNHLKGEKEAFKNAFIAGHTAASLGMVKKDAVVKAIRRYYDGSAYECQENLLLIIEQL